jgi:hypothetical protein
MEPTLEIGSVIIIDGLAWVVESFRGETLAYARNEQEKKAIWFARHEAKVLGAGLFGLPGRIEAPVATPSATVVAGVAAVDTGVTL